MLNLKIAIRLCIYHRAIYIEVDIAMIATLKNVTFCQTKKKEEPRKE
jgi:hypothetical protein